MDKEYQSKEDYREFFPLTEEMSATPDPPSLSEKTLRISDRHLPFKPKHKKRLNKFILLPTMVFLLTMIFIEDSIKTTTWRLFNMLSAAVIPCGIFPPDIWVAV